MSKKPDPVIILASNSPRRRELLHQIGLSFDTAPSNVDEQVKAGELPETYAVRVARAKAQATAGRVGRGIIIAADTIVVQGDRILGKPGDRHDAERMLLLLSGRMHVVITGLAIIDSAEGKTVTGTSLTRVWFRDLSKDEITCYIKGGEPFDKAGAYGIQGKGALFVTKIEGCYFNVVGLPLSLLGELLRNFGIRLL
jgi:nucleoside triphosphate pyrophosphatase